MTTKDEALKNAAEFIESVHDYEWGSWQDRDALLFQIREALAQPEQEPEVFEYLQQKCAKWGVYWRAPDAHGVTISHEQALELLRDALGVEVAITVDAQARQPLSFDDFLKALGAEYRTRAQVDDAHGITGDQAP